MLALVIWRSCQNGVSSSAKSQIRLQHEIATRDAKYQPRHFLLTVRKLTGFWFSLARDFSSFATFSKSAKNNDFGKKSTSIETNQALRRAILMRINKKR